MFEINEIRSEFPILQTRVRSHPLSYLDNGASAQKPREVIDAMTKAYELEYSNVHRGIHYLSNLATDKFEAVRETVKNFIGAKGTQEIVFTSGSTEGLNLVAHAWGKPNLAQGDEIILSLAEHHSNIIPWHFLRQKIGIKLVWVEPELDGSISTDRIISTITNRTKLIALTHMSNVLGSIVDVKKVCECAKKRNIVTVIDGSQAIVHLPVDVSDLGCDFYVFTGHKLYGPTGSGVLYMREPRADEMQPFHGGGAMINNVSKDSITYNVAPFKFEAGTPPIVPIIGLGTAIEFIQKIGKENILKHEKLITKYLGESLKDLDFLSLQGTSSCKGGIYSFTIVDNKLHPHDVATLVDQKGVAIRAGHHCAQPLLEHLQVPATCRASLALYNNESDIDQLSEALVSANKLVS